MNQKYINKYEVFIENTLKPFIVHVKNLENNKHEFNEEELGKLKKIRTAIDQYENLVINSLKRSNNVNWSDLKKEIKHYETLRKNINETISSLSHKHEDHKALIHLSNILSDCKIILEDLEKLKSDM